MSAFGMASFRNAATRRKIADAPAVTEPGCPANLPLSFTGDEDETVRVGSGRRRRAGDDPPHGVKTALLATAKE
jgi:hypothetical protein